MEVIHFLARRELSTCQQMRGMAVYSATRPPTFTFQGELVVDTPFVGRLLSGEERVLARIASHLPQDGMCLLVEDWLRTYFRCELPTVTPKLIKPSAW